MSSVCVEIYCRYYIVLCAICHYLKFPALVTIQKKSLEGGNPSCHIQTPKNEPLQNTTQRRMTVLKSRWQKAKRLRSRPTPSPKGKASMVLSTESLTKPCRPRDSKAIKLPRHLRYTAADAGAVSIFVMDQKMPRLLATILLRMAGTSIPFPTT